MSAAASAKLKNEPALTATQSFQEEVAALQRADRKACRERKNGHTPLFHKYREDFNRVVCGQAQVSCVILVLSETYGADRDQGTKPPERTRPMSSVEFWWYYGCSRETGAPLITLRAIEAALESLCRKDPQSGSAVLCRSARGKRGFYEYWVPLETWKTLPDPSPKKPAASSEDLDSTDDSNEEDTAAQRRKLRYDPVPMQFGKRSKALPVRITEKVTSAIDFGDVDDPEMVCEHGGRGDLHFQVTIPSALKQNLTVADAQRRKLRSNESPQQPELTLEQRLNQSIADEERKMLRAMVQRSFRGLGPCPDPVVDELRAIQNGGPLADLALRFHGKSAKDWEQVVVIAHGQKAPADKPISDVTAQRFAQFHEAVIALGMRHSSIDMQEAQAEFTKLSIEQQLPCVNRLRQAKETNEFDPAFMPLPHNYIKRRMFEREPRPSPVSKSDVATKGRQEQASRLLEWAEKVDRKHGR